MANVKTYKGSAFLSYGFRPFFLIGATYSGLSILLWLPLFYGEFELPGLFAKVDWHIHELYFGYLPAIISGFLFTAVPNWTGRMPIRGTPLLLLVIIWLAGRLAISVSSYLGWQIAMLVDLTFLSAIIGIITREIIAAKNWKNVKLLFPIVFLLLANGSFHLEAHYNGISDISRRLALTAIITLIMVIGGRIIPSFTRNWLAQLKQGTLPTPFDRFDTFSIAVSVTALVLWTFMPNQIATAFAMLAAAVSQVYRLLRWVGYRVINEPLVAVLHISYFFIPLGFLLLGISILLPQMVGQVAGIHALSIGAVGGMTLSVMVRASLGHTGQPLRAGAFSTIMFISIFAAAIARILLAFDIGDHDILFHLAALGWIVAFLGFAISFAPALFRPRAT